MKRFSILILLCLQRLSLIGIAGAQAVTGPNCTEAGFFPIYDGTCQNFYFCMFDGEKYIALVAMCAPANIFDPTMGGCVSETVSTCQQTTMTPMTTQAPCVRYGRFAIQDVNCKRYYLCYWDGVGYAIMDNMSCPNTLVFEPVSEKCVPPTRYICPGIVG